MTYPKLIEDFIEQLTRLPGVGRRSAERMVFWFLNQPASEAETFVRALSAMKDNLHLCRQCANLAQGDLCAICRDPARDRTTLCVVEDHKHLYAIERTGSYQGLYHVLLGAIAPTEGRGPGDLNVERLIQRVRECAIVEVVLATDPDTEGEMTALHIAQELKPLGIRVSRIGLGLPVGGSVEYADISTLSVSLTSRRAMSS